MRFHRTLAVLTFSALVGCMPQVDHTTPLTNMFTLRADGTRDTSSLLIHLGQVYVAEYPSITLLTEIEDGEAWFLTPEERRGLLVTHHYLLEDDLWVVPLARDGLVFIMNREASIDNLSLNALRGIYQGTFTSWEQLGGANIDIVPIVRGAQADLQKEFGRLVMGQRRITPNARLVSSSEQVRALLHQEEGGIAFITLSQYQQWEEDTTLMLIRLEQVLASRQTIRENLYALPLTIFAIGSDMLPSPYQDFISWIQSEEGRAIIEDNFVLLQ